MLQSLHREPHRRSINESNLHELELTGFSLNKTVFFQDPENRSFGAFVESSQALMRVRFPQIFAEVDKHVDNWDSLFELVECSQFQPKPR